MPLTIDEARERVAALIAALDARDFDAIGAMPWFDDERSEFKSAITGAEGVIHRGLEGLRAWARSVDETWEDFSVELVRVEPAGPNRVVVELHNTGIARGSRVPLDQRTGQIWTFSDEGITLRNDSFSAAHLAFEAAGVPYEPSTRSV